ncbi:hypothetical protein WME94_27985 [Sorangium sp. So ce429]
MFNLSSSSRYPLVKSTSVSTSWNLRRLAYASSALLLGALSLGCVASPEGDPEEDKVGEAADALTSYIFEMEQSTTNTVGDNIGLKSQVTCVLSGVAGNLSEGFEWYSKDIESIAWVTEGNTATGWQYVLQAHGGAFMDNMNHREWLDNPVTAHATCFPTTTNVKNGNWEAQPSHLGMADPVKIAELDPNNRRQCFLSGLWGVDGAWDHSWNFARVRKVTTTSGTHPTTGWYIEGYLLPSDVDGSRPEIFARCVDFPVGTTFESDYVETEAGEMETKTISSGTHTKACALTGVYGALNQNHWTDGVLIYEPAAPGGQWTIKAANGKSAEYVCVN